MWTESQLVEAKKTVESALLAIPQVTGVGICDNPDGTIALAVYVVSKRKRVIQEISLLMGQVSSDLPFLVFRTGHFSIE